MTKKYLSVIPALFLFLSAPSVQADDVSELKKEVQQLKEMLQQEASKRKELESKVNGIQERDDSLIKAAAENKQAGVFDLRNTDNPFSISGGATTAIQSTSGNKKSNSTFTDRSAFTYSLDLALNTRLSENQRFVVALEAGQGNGVNGRTGGVGAVSSTFYDPYNTSQSVNNNTLAHLSVSGLYYEGIYRDLTASIGKMDLNLFFDQNEYANSETSQFMGSLFVRNTGSIYADVNNYYAPVLALEYAANDYIDLTLAGAGSNYDDIFNNNKNVFQVNIKPHFWADKTGNYRIYYIIDGNNFTRVSDSTAKNNTEYGFSLDQQLTEALGVFARGGWQDKNLTNNTVQMTWSGGLNLAGSLWGCDTDNVGIAYGELNFNKKIVAQENRKNETHFEAYYNAEVLPQVHLTPDIQYIRNVTGDNGGLYRNVMVYGIRGQYDF